MNERSFILGAIMNCATVDKRKMILDATLKLLASCGFHGFSMKQLAREAGVATGTIYLYFDDRSTLIAELQSSIIDAFSEAAFFDVDKNEPLKQQYQKVCNNVWHFCLNNREITLSKGQFDHLPVEVLKSQRHEIWNNRRPLSRLYEQARKQGILKPLPDDVLASLSFEPIIQIAVQQLLGLLDINASQLEQIMDAAWDAITQSCEA